MNKQERSFPRYFVAAMAATAALFYVIAYLKFGSSTASYEFIASGDTFFSLAVSLTVAVILSPVTHRTTRWTEDRIEQVQATSAAYPAAK